MPYLGFFNFKSQMFWQPVSQIFWFSVVDVNKMFLFKSEYVKFYLILIHSNNAETSFDENVL